MSAAPAPSPRLALWMIIAAGCLAALVTFGARSSFGLFTLPITGAFGWTRETYGFAMAVQGLAWGIAQPIAGGIADRYGTGRTLAVGAVIYALGIVGMAYSTTEPMFIVTTGLITGVGIATSSFSIVMAAFGRAAPVHMQGIVYGIATAASSFGQFVFAPLGQSFISGFGWQTALLLIAALVLLVIPLSTMLTGKSARQVDQIDIPVFDVLRQALRHNSYRLLVIGFFVCGFHLSFISVHLPAYLVQCGLSPEVGSWSLAIIGLFNAGGSLAAGWLGDRMPKQYLLAALYLTRAVSTSIFLLIPVSATTTYLYAAVLGLSWLATVPPTAGLVTVFFGARYLGLLYGVAFFSHQIGSFVGVWLGGYVYDRTGAYDLVWYLGILLGLASAAIHLPIREHPASALAARLA